MPILSLDVKPADGVVAAGTERPEHKHDGGDVVIWFGYSTKRRDDALPEVLTPD